MKMHLFRSSTGMSGAALALLAAALLPACKSVEVPKVPGITPYRMVIQQGNFISQEMVAQLKPGMTKEQVRFVLGTPLVTDIFHADRWDYVFFRETPDGKKEQRNLSVVFEKDKLARVLGDLMPSDGKVQSSGFDPLIKPDVKKPEAKPEPKPAAKAESRPEPKAEAAPAATAQGGPNWGTTSFEAKAEPAAAPKPEEKPKEESAAAEEKKPGFLDRLREKFRR
jgi:outer membrane protein assembly factor BamE